MIATVGSLRRGIRNVLRNPVRLVLVVVLLGASLTFTAAMLALNSGAQNEISQAQHQVGTTITISPAQSFGFGGVFGTISSKQVADVENTPDVVTVVQNVESRYSGSNLYGTAKIPKAFQQFTQHFHFGGNGNGNAGFGGRSGSGGVRITKTLNGAKGGTIEPSITGITGAANGISLTNGTVQMAKGSDLSPSDANSDVALMSESLAKANKLNIGSTFKLNSTKVKLIGEYVVTGATSSSFLGNSAAGNSIVVPLKLAESALKLSGVTSLTATAYTAADVNPVVSHLQSALGSGVTVSSDTAGYAPTLNALTSTSHNIQAALIASIITAALVIIFAVFIIVRERTREIGVLKAIGASSTNIVAQFTAEVLGMSVGAAVAAAVLLAVFGGQIAKAFSVSTAQAASAPRSGFGGGPGGGFGGGGFNGTAAPTRFGLHLPALHTTPLSAGLSGGSLLALLGLAIGLAVIASWVPTWYVSRLRPARVLSNA